MGLYGVQNSLWVGGLQAGQVGAWGTTGEEASVHLFDFPGELAICSYPSFIRKQKLRFVDLTCVPIPLSVTGATCARLLAWAGT